MLPMRLTPIILAARRRARIFLSIILLLAAALLLTGCSSMSRKSGPQAAAPVSSQPWIFNGQRGQTYTTRHYVIHSTCPDEQGLRLAQVMEGAWTQYTRLLAPTRPDGPPLTCYFFATRRQWDAYTRATTAGDAAIYLQINRGGYSIGDRYAIYYLGDDSSFSVGAHEGWHQYLSRQMIGRLPPFLEEGCAGLFESIQWDNDLPRWKMGQNAGRAAGLARAAAAGQLYPLKQLVGMHAGDIVNQPPGKIEAFYCQSWAFALFLWEADRGRFRPAFGQMLHAAAAGQLLDPTGALNDKSAPWNPAAAAPMLEYYLQMDMVHMQSRFTSYLHALIAADIP